MPLSHRSERRGGVSACSQEPEPADSVILIESIEQLMNGLQGTEREVVRLCLQGYTVAEISLEVGRSERTVRRFVARTRERLLKRCLTTGGSSPRG